jgi:hypothetical protein
MILVDIWFSQHHTACQLQLTFSTTELSDWRTVSFHMVQRNQPHLLKGRARQPLEWSTQREESETANLPATWTDPDLSGLLK